MTNAYSFEGDHLQPLDWQPARTLRWAAWRPDGGVVLAVGNGGSAVLSDRVHFDYLATASKQNLRGAAWSPDGSTALLVGNRGAVLRLRGESLEELGGVTSENLRRVAWHPSGAFALVVGNAGTVLRYDAAVETLSPLPADRAHTLRSVAFRADGAYALVGAYASRFAGYPRPHPLYRCDGRYLQALLASDDEDDFVSVDWSGSGRALACGYAWLGDGSVVNKALTFDGSVWQARAWPAAGGVVLGGAWRPGSDEALLVGEGGLVARLDVTGAFETLTSGTTDNLIGPFWRPDGASALLLRGPGDKVYTV
ncbi:MAG TPA: WD40 repeat domain-containing protein [Dehalococcoidia bacterium]|nr:WD40 repeat domain-containing protein [Dehalococcoidia bacterium]